MALTDLVEHAQNSEWWGLGNYLWYMIKFQYQIHTDHKNNVKSMLFDIIVRSLSRIALNRVRESFCLQMISVIRNTWQEKGMEGVMERRKASKYMGRETLREAALSNRGNFWTLHEQGWQEETKTIHVSMLHKDWRETERSKRRVAAIKDFVHQCRKYSEFS